MNQNENSEEFTESDAGGNLKIGLVKTKITPESPVWLYGYATKSRACPFTGKLHDIYAKVMAIEDSQGHRTVLITADLCVLRAREAKALVSRIMDKTGLRENQILINLSHTHSGPTISILDVNSRYPIPQDELDKIIDYTRKLIEILADAASAALADLQPAHLSLGTGKVDFVMNRRQFDDQGHYTNMGPNPVGFADPRVPVLRVDTPDGTLRALIFGLACHAVTLGGDSLNKLSGDYPGFAQQYLEADCPGVQAMFVQGCGGDANTHPRSTDDQVKQVHKHGRILADEVLRIAKENLRPISGPLRTEMAWVNLPFKKISRQHLEEMSSKPMWESYNAKRILEILDSGEYPPTYHAAPLAVWQFGDDLTLVGISGETVSGYVPLIEEVLGPERLWVAGYTNQVFGYLPSARIVAEGGYETIGTLVEIGFFAAEVQDVVVETVRQLAEKAGRKCSQDKL